MISIPYFVLGDGTILVGDKQNTHADLLFEYSQQTGQSMNDLMPLVQAGKTGRWNVTENDWIQYDPTKPLDDGEQAEILERINPRSSKWKIAGIFDRNKYPCPDCGNPLQLKTFKDADGRHGYYECDACGYTYGNKPPGWIDRQDSQPGNFTLQDLGIPEESYDYYRSAKTAAGGPMSPANYTPDDPLDLQGKQPLFDAMDTQWWTLPPDEAERAVVNAFRATMLSPRMNLKGNAVLYQTLMNVDPHESDPNVFESIIRDLKTRWDVQGQPGLGQDPNDVMAVDEILPGKFQPGIWTNIRRIAALGPYADEIYKAAMHDIQQYGGTGKYFRDRILQLNIPGVKAKVASFAWLALAPNTSELGTIDVHMMRHLGEDSDAPRNTTHYLQLEDQLRQERNDAYGPDVPLSKYQWGVWDKRRTPGFHQDHSPLRPVDPTPYTDVHWAPQSRPVRPQQEQVADPNQLTMAKWKLASRSRWAMYRLGGYTLRGNIVGAQGTAQGIVVRPDQQSQEEILQILAQLPTHEQDYQKQRKQLPEWTINRGGKVGALIHVDWELDPNDEEEIGSEEYFQSLPPSEVEVPEDIMLDAQLENDPGQVTEWLSDNYGWLVRGWDYLRHSKVADMRMNPDGTGVSYAPGAIYVSEWIDVNDNWLLYHNAVVGIIAGKGGATSHGVTVARERNIPIVVDVQGYENIKPGDTITMDASTGIIEGNGGTVEQEQGEAQQAEEPVIAFVWSQGQGVYQPVPTGSAGSAALHREMIKEMRHAGTFNKQDYAIGVVYADSHVQQQGKPSDQEALDAWLNTIIPAKTETALTV